MSCLLVAWLLVAASCTPQAKDPGPLNVPVSSWELMDVTSLNAQVDKAVGGGAEWPRSALLTALNLIGGDAELRSLDLVQVGNRGERPDTVVVKVARDGFLDDSVRGDWHRIELYQLADGTWRVHEIRRAFRCWRGRNTEHYAADRCL